MTLHISNSGELLDSPQQTEPETVKPRKFGAYGLTLGEESYLRSEGDGDIVEYLTFLIDYGYSESMQDKHRHNIGKWRREFQKHGLTKDTIHAVLYNNKYGKRYSEQLRRSLTCYARFRAEKGDASLLTLLIIEKIIGARRKL